MFSLSDAESSDCNVTVEVVNERSGKTGNDMEQGDCGFWHEDKSCMGKLSCLSVRMWIWLISDELNIVVELLAAFSGTDTTFNYIFTFITKKKTNWLTN